MARMADLIILALMAVLYVETRVREPSSGLTRLIQRSRLPDWL